MNLHRMHLLGSWPYALAHLELPLVTRLRAMTSTSEAMNELLRWEREKFFFFFFMLRRPRLMLQLDTQVGSGRLVELLLSWLDLAWVKLDILLRLAKVG